MLRAATTRQHHPNNPPLTPRTGLTRVKTTLLKERRALLDHVRDTTPSTLVEALPDPAAAISLHVAPRDDEPMTLDVPALTVLRMQYDNSREQQLALMRKKLRTIGTGAGAGAGAEDLGSSTASPTVATEVGTAVKVEPAQSTRTSVSSQGGHPLDPLAFIVPVSAVAPAQVPVQASAPAQVQSEARLSALQSELAVAHIQIEEYKQEAHSATQQVMHLYRCTHTVLYPSSPVTHDRSCCHHRETTLILTTTLLSGPFLTHTHGAGEQSARHPGGHRVHFAGPQRQGRGQCAGRRQEEQRS